MEKRVSNLSLVIDDVLGIHNVWKKWLQRLRGPHLDLQVQWQGSRADGISGWSQWCVPTWCQELAAGTRMVAGVSVVVHAGVRCEQLQGPVLSARCALVWAQAQQCRPGTGVTDTCVPEAMALWHVDTAVDLNWVWNHSNRKCTHVCVTLGLLGFFN